MILYIAIGIEILASLLTPYSDGLFNTSLWMAKILSPSELIDTSEGKQMVKLNQAAFMDGWPSNIPIGVNLLMLVGVVLGFFYRWWGGILAYLIYAFLMGTFLFFFRKPVTYYVMLFARRLTNRIADYRKMNDLDRAAAAEELLEEVKVIFTEYMNTGIKTPTSKQVKNNPLGDVQYLKTSSAY